MNELGRLELRSIAVWCVVTCSVLGCAEGYEGVEAIRQSAASGLPGGGAGTIAPRAGSGGGAGGPSGASGASGAAGGSAGTGSAATGSGMPCLRGETAACTCVDKGTMGQMTCVFDSSSPLDGFFTDCGRGPEPMTTDPGDVMMTGTGGMSGSGSGGSGGRSGSGGSSGGAGSGGSTSPPPTTGGGRSCASPCNQPCFPIGILACCNPLGVCGCTWAPGGYCL